MLVIARGKLTLRAHLSEVRPDPPDDVGGLSVQVRLPKELEKASPGYFSALGDAGWTDESLPLVRVYWNITATGAFSLMRLLTRQFNEAGTPFRFKTLDHPSAYTRSDAAVLYLGKRGFQESSAVLRNIHSQLYAYLRPGVPAFTMPLAPGLGFAESPEGGSSFGLSRCLLVAEGLQRGREIRARGAGARLRLVEERFLEAGVDPSRPYLNPGSTDTYLPLASAGRGAPPRHHAGARHTAAELLSAANQIGRRLADGAIETAQGITWVGPRPKADQSAREPGFRFGSLGPSLYSGTSGIALFLAELSRCSGSRSTRDLALRAFDHALAAAESQLGSPPCPAGAFDGWCGVALAGAWGGRILGETRLVSSSSHLVGRGLAASPVASSFDLISGMAGQLLSLLILSNLLQSRSLVQRAIDMGDALLGTAVMEQEAISWREQEAISWRSEGSTYSRNLTGFSHGTAGAATSLLELFRVTGADRFRKAAELAFAYEQRYFSSQQGNWPDFRDSAGWGRSRAKGKAFPSHWCHGAPGIALSRMRAREILGDDRYLAQAGLALETTLREARRRVSQGTGDIFLCHGLAGDAEVLLCASRNASEGLFHDKKMTRLLCGEIIRRLGLLDEAPSGTMDTHPLGLMSGIAGAGYLFLRLRDDSVPSILMLRPDDFSNAHLIRRVNPSASQTSSC